MPGILYIIIYSTWTIVSATVSYDGHQIIKLSANNHSEVENLKNAITDLDLNVEEVNFVSEEEATAYIRVSKDVEDTHTQLYLLTAQYEVVIEDVGKILNEEDLKNIAKKSKRAAPENLDDFDYTIYHPLEEIEQWMDFVVEKYNFVEKVMIGTSYEGRPLHLLHISRNPEANNPAFYMDAATHAREWIAPSTLMYVTIQILGNDTYASLLENLDFYFVPIVNLDGYVFTWTTDRLWRKTRQRYPFAPDDSKCIGADANRNFDAHFEGKGSSNDSCSIFYRGPYPESEPVVEHLANFIRSKKDEIKGDMTLHSYSQLIMYPYDYTSKRIPENNAELYSIASEMSEAIKSINGKIYRWGNGASTLYLFSGSTTDWAYEKAGVKLSFTMELRDTGKYRFILPADQIMPTAKETMAGLNVLMQKIVQKYGHN